MQPETKQEQQDIEALKLRLKEAVMLENFEAAAKYRDEIKALQAKEEHNA
jgi:protein-arginine kinase activator protein McsA